MQKHGLLLFCYIVHELCFIVTTQVKHASVQCVDECVCVCICLSNMGQTVSAQLSSGVSITKGSSRALMEQVLCHSLSKNPNDTCFQSYFWNIKGSTSPCARATVWGYTLKPVFRNAYHYHTHVKRVISLCGRGGLTWSDGAIIWEAEVLDVFFFNGREQKVRWKFIHGSK